MGSRTSIRFAAACLMASLPTIAGEATAGFTIVDLGPASAGRPEVGNAINNLGGVAGTSGAGPDTAAQQATRNGTFTGVSLAPIGYAGASTATGMNDLGQVTGTFRDTKDNSTHSYVTSGTGPGAGTATDLGSFSFHPTPNSTVSSTSVATTGINDAGAVVGTAHLTDGTYRAFDSSSGVLKLLAPIGDGGYSQGSGINAGGQIVGTFEQSTGVYQAFTTDKHDNPVALLANYTMAGFGLDSYGTAINASGAVAGYGDFGQGYSHAFLAQAPGAASGPGKAAAIDLGVLPGFTSSYAYGINSSSLVVGKLDDGGADPTAFLYDPTLGMVPLLSLLSSSDQARWTSLTTATAINDAGQVTGQGLVDGQLHAFELTPVPGESLFTPAAGSVPTPPALVLSAFGIAIAAAWARVRPGRSSGPAGA